MDAPRLQGKLLWPLVFCVLGGCTISRPQVAPEQPPLPPPSVREEESAVAAAEVQPPPDAASLVGLTVARCAVVLGMDAIAGQVLAEVARSAAADGDYRLLARTLYMRGFLALREDEQGRTQAEAFLRQAQLADPYGPFAEPAKLSLQLLGQVSRQAEELQGLKQQVSTAAEVRQQDQDRVQTLQAQVEALQKQLDELKEVHLRVESEKEDDPS